MVTISRRGSTSLIVSLAVVAGVVGIAAVATVAPASDPPVAASTPAPARLVPSEPTPSPTSIIGPADSISAEGSIDPSWCTQNQVMISVVDGDAATGHRAAGYRATNVSTEACVLDGYPDVAIADPLGADVGVTVVHGGSFMTQDPGRTAVMLPPGGTAMALLGWDASDGRTAIGAVYIAAYPGLVRTVIPADWDMTAATTVAVTAWGPDLGNFQE